MELPYNMKIHAIIEKTANFVSEQGGQMEIIIKMKQHANPQFAFMHLDNPLHPYYKHLKKEIKSGAYKPIQNRKVSRSEDEDDDEHYLHPSLMAGKAKDVPEFTVPTINFRRSQDDSYSLLVKNLSQHLIQEKDDDSSQSQQNYNATMPAECYNEDGSLNIYGQNYELLHNYIVPPPPDKQPVIDKMAEYVAKNGEDFETIVKSKNDKRFDFLYPGSEFHDYYIYKRNCAKAQMCDNNKPETKAEPKKDTKQPKKEEIPFISSNNPEIEADRLENKQPVLCSQKNTDQQDSSDSLDFLNSPSDSKDDPVVKASKVPKGPISFSLKVKDNEASPDIGKPTTLLMDDDSEEEGSGEKDQHEKPNSAEEATPVNNITKTTEVENKAPKVVTEAMEAKLAEERIKDKLLATARERLAQQRKEKQLQLEQQKRAEQHKKEKQILMDQQRKEKELQLERKRKAALFLKMLRRKNLDATAGASDSVEESGFTSEFWALPDTSNCTSPESGILFPIDKIIISGNNVNPSLIPGIKTNWSPDHQSEDSPSEEPSDKLSSKHNSDSDSDKQEKKKKRKRRSRSRSRDRSNHRSSKSSRRSKERHRSPPRHYKESKREKEKQLPAAYAFVNRSRSRSRSPRRYRSIPNWKRR